MPGSPSNSSNSITLRKHVAISMKLFLIRHGETVDNVAGLYAGVRDSTLTNHGVEQTERLGDYFVRNGVRFTHIFASPLSRAHKTAEAVWKAQTKATQDKTAPGKLAIIKVPEIMERDFGYYEGKPFSTRPGSKSYAGDSSTDKAKEQPGFVDVESEELMALRIDSFLDARILPLFDEESKDRELIVAVVSHGMLLTHFWRRLLLRLPRKSLTITSEVTAARDNIVLDHIGGWSNTGYMELTIRKDQELTTPVDATKQSEEPCEFAEEATLPTPIPPPLEPEDAKVSVAPATSNEKALGWAKRTQSLTGYSTTILAVDSKLHLLGLKRQRGGIGSLAHDESQRKLDAFFKKPKLT